MYTSIISYINVSYRIQYTNLLYLILHFSYYFEIYTSYLIQYSILHHILSYRVFEFVDRTAPATSVLVPVTSSPSNLISAPTTHPAPTSTPSTVSIQDVAFTYASRPDHPVLKGVSVEIVQGTFVAFVGRSGTGKSTLCRLLCGLHPCCSGKILIDGVNVATADKNWLRSQVCVWEAAARVTVLTAVMYFLIFIFIYSVL